MATRSTVQVDGAGNHRANGVYYDTGTFDPDGGFHIYRQNNGYEVEYSAFRTDPEGGGFSTFQWGLFDSGGNPIYFGDQNQTGGGDPSAVGWHAANPANIPPFGPLPAPTVELLTLTMARTGRNKPDNDALNDIAYNTSALSGGIPVPEPTGATNLATSQVTSSGTAATLAVARATRTSVLFRNLDATNSVYIGKATVSSSNGTLLKAGESVSFTYVGLIQVIAAAGTPIVSVADEYN